MPLIALSEDLFVGKPCEALRRHAGEMVRAAVEAADPAAAVKRFVRRRGNALRIGEVSYALQAIRHIFVVGGGKACAPMARALEGILEDRITSGIVTVKYGYTLPLERVRLVEAGHPLPDASGQRAAEAMLDLVSSAGKGDLVICLISGGGSALLPAPVEGVSLEDKVTLTDLLLKFGGTIQEINIIRKHLSRIKGGQLARAAAPARVAVLILSDVVGNPLDAIASGPAVADPSTFADAMEIVARYGLEERIPQAALRHLRRGAAGAMPETPKPDDPIFSRVHTVLIGSNELAALATAAKAKGVGFNTLILTTFMEGEAREAARVLAAVAKSVRSSGRPLVPPACLIAGGETTVTVRGQGKGGRCQEFALAAALAIAGWPEVVVVAFGTDGTDGPTDAAGAIADGSTLARARRMGLSPARALEANGAYPFFSALSDLIITGPTNTNVNDLYLALVGATPDRRSSTVGGRKDGHRPSGIGPRTVVGRRKPDGRSSIVD